MFEAHAFAEAIAHHRAGRLDLAEAGYRTILASSPQHADALHLLGVIAHQRGNHARAVELIGRAISLRPNEPSFASNLADAYRGLGKFAEAEQFCRQALLLQPGNLDAQLNLGRIYQSVKRWSEAESAFQHALKLNPNDARGYFYLGELQREMGRIHESIESYRRAVERNPKHAHALCQLGRQLITVGEVAAAEPYLRRAVEINPRLTSAVGDLGACLARLGRTQDAWQVFSRALSLQPDDPSLRISIGHAYLDHGDGRAAREQFEHVLQLHPDNVLALCGLADVDMDCDRIEDALLRYERALRIDSSCAKARRGFANALFESGEVVRAVDCLHEGIDAHTAGSELYSQLGAILTTAGDLQGAVAAHREALRINPASVPALSGLATCLGGQLPDNDLRLIENRLQQAGDDQDRAMLHFGLAHVYDARRDFVRAAEQLREGNALQTQHDQARNRVYTPSSHHAHVDALIRLYTREFFDQRREFGAPSERPVFVFGMPRSGTTLVEQILASHPRIYGAGERRFAHQSLLRLPGELGLANVNEITPERLTKQAVRACAEWHLEQLRKLDQGKCERIVDKMPANYLNLGWLALTLPKARFIHCRRDVRDVGLSCWMTKFAEIRWANDLEHIAHRIQEYQRLMEHWRKVLPIQILELDYEKLVENQEAQSQKLIDWIGLQWDPACLEFHKTTRLVKTASVTQVRQPMYSRSVGRWKNYEAQLHPLLQSLNVEMV